MSGDQPMGAVSTFSTGRVDIHPEHVRGSRLPALLWILGSRTWEGWRPIQVFVIEHEQGLMLFDTGQDPASISDPDYYPASRLVRLVYSRLARFQVRPEQSVTAQLRSLGYDVRDVRYVVLSHLHQDHIGGLQELTHARFVVAEAEWRAMRAPNAELGGYLPRHTDLPGVTWQQVAFQPTTDASLAPFPAAHDLFSDGSVVLLPTPGHTPGSMSLLLRGHHPPLLFVGDVTYDVDVLHAGLVPGIGRHAELLETTRRVLQFEEHTNGLAILPAHDRASAARLTAAGGRSI